MQPPCPPPPGSGPPGRGGEGGRACDCVPARVSHPWLLSVLSVPANSLAPRPLQPSLCVWAPCGKRGVQFRTTQKTAVCAGSWQAEGGVHAAKRHFLQQSTCWPGRTKQEHPQPHKEGAPVCSSAAWAHTRKLSWWMHVVADETDRLGSAQSPATKRSLPRKAVTESRGCHTPTPLHTPCRGSWRSRAWGPSRRPAQAPARERASWCVCVCRRALAVSTGAVESRFHAGPRSP